MRLDGDMYESTVDVLYHLYDKLSVGGYVIMDDWFGFPSKVACEDFFQVHNIHPTIVPIDDLAAYWQKTEQVEIHSGGHHILHTFLALFQSYYHLPTPLSNTLC